MGGLILNQRSNKAARTDRWNAAHARSKTVDPQKGKACYFPTRMGRREHPCKKWCLIRAIRLLRRCVALLHPLQKICKHRAHVFTQAKTPIMPATSIFIRPRYWLQSIFVPYLVRGLHNFVLSIGEVLAQRIRALVCTSLKGPTFGSIPYRPTTSIQWLSISLSCPQPGAEPGVTTQDAK